MSIEPAEFARLWRTLADARKVAAATGLSHDAVRSRASRLRRKGVDLPILRRGPTKPPAGDGVGVRQRRRAMGLSQAELAARCGVSQSTVSRVERGLLPASTLGEGEGGARV